MSYLISDNGNVKELAFKVQKNYVPKKANFKFVPDAEENVTKDKRRQRMTLFRNHLHVEKDVTVHLYKGRRAEVRKRKEN